MNKEEEKENRKQFVREIGERIKRIRKERKLTQETIVEEMEKYMNPNTISAIERGTVDPKISTLNKIAKVLKVQLADIIPLERKEEEFIKRSNWYICKIKDPRKQELLLYLLEALVK